MSDFHRRSIHLTLLALAVTGISACSSLNNASTRVVEMVTPYKADIVQGNVVTREQMALIKPGMQRAQVRDILGTALLVSIFHADRWDYVFTLRQQGTQAQSRRVTVFFKDGVVERTEADDLPTEAEFVAALKSPVRSKTPLPLEASEEALKKYPAPAKPAPAAATAVIAPTDYPPLEAARP